LILSTDAKEIVIKIQKPIEKNGSDSEDEHDDSVDSKILEEIDLEGDI